MTAPARPYPNLFIELVDARPEKRNSRGRVTAPARPAYARVCMTPIGLLETDQPERLEREADELYAAAAALRARQERP